MFKTLSKYRELRIILSAICILDKHDAEDGEKISLLHQYCYVESELPPSGQVCSLAWIQPLLMFKSFPTEKLPEPEL